MTHQPSVCPYCGQVADNTAEEVVHMETHHPDVVAHRMREAGFHEDEETGKWIDDLASED